jgi:hypothetical protein
MDATSAILMAQALSLTAFGIFALWYVVPWLKARGHLKLLGLAVFGELKKVDRLIPIGADSR